MHFNSLANAIIVALLLLFFSSIPNSTLYLPLFSDSPNNFQTVHRNFSTLLPLLPFLTSPPANTLLVTIATSSFKPLLFNWICFLRYKARWGQFENRVNGKMIFEFPKFLVLTSDESFAEELGSFGVMTWLLASQENESVSNKGSDIFSNLRSLQLIANNDQQNSNLTLGKKDSSQIITWGSFQYQSLMLERSVGMSVLIGAVSELQKTQRKGNEIDGVLLADNDAVWLSSPSSSLSKSYSGCTSLEPSFIFSLDSPPTSTTPWGSSKGLPCACFIYSRTVDTNIPPFKVKSAKLSLSTSEKTSAIWRSIAVCHSVMLLKIISSTHSTSNHLKAESFQSNCLGPAIFIAQQFDHFLSATISHSKWMTALSSNSTKILLEIFEEYHNFLNKSTLLELAKQIQHAPSSLHASLDPFQTNALPFDLFPSGRRYFFESEGKVRIKPVVVHANFIIGKEKQNYLKKVGLWALRGDDVAGWSCDFDLIQKS